MDAETIAKGLSEAQKNCVMALGPDFQLPPHGASQVAWSMFYGVGLTSYRYDSAAKRRLYRLTEAGLAVRALLKGE